MKLVCLLLTLGAFLIIPALAQSADSTNAPAETPPAPHPSTPPNRPPPLTKEENAEINKAYADVIKTNPDFVTEQKDLKDKMKALQDQQKDLQQKIITAMIQVNPNLAPIIAAHPNVHLNTPRVPKKESKPTATSTPSTNAPTATPPTN